MPCKFDTVVDRRDHASYKWDKYRGRDVIPMWVADMDFRAPPEVVTALNEITDRGVFGYVVPPDGAVDAIVAMLAREYNWHIDPQWLVWMPGLVPALNLACRAYCESDQAIMTTTPIYPPFLQAPKFSERKLITVPLANDDGTWRFDLDAMRAAVTPTTRLLIVCNPYNPVGRAFRRKEIEPLAQFCEDHDLVICSDEVHCQLILDDIDHVPIATLAPEIAARTITLMAPSKTYNLPGLCCAFAIISDNKLRHRFKRHMQGIMPEMNAYAYAGCAAAYTHGEPWRRELVDYLRGNRDLLASFIGDELPGVSVGHIEATYLAWLDVRELELEDPLTFFENAGVGLSDGRWFGGTGYMRLNFGCPRAALQEALERIRAALV
jgi:cystathionine beta-lyase